MRAHMLLKMSLAVLNCALWSGLLLLSFSLLRSVIGQHVTGYPSTQQLVFYVAIPLMMIALSIGDAIWGLGVNQEAPNWLQALVLAFLIPYAVAYAGGM